MIVFDLDDTLYHEADFVRSGKRAVAEYIRANGLAADIEGKWTPEMLDAYRSHIPEIALSDDASSALDMLVKAGVKIGLVTDGRSITQRNKIMALGLDRYIDDANVMISEEVGADKLDGRPFALLQSRNPGELSWIYVGDNPSKDFVWPNRHGWTTVMLRDVEGVNIHPQSIVDAYPVYMANEVTDTICDFVKKLISKIQ